jgi:chemotaxis protein MotB
VRIDVGPEGLRVEMTERDDSVFFEVGSARVKPALTRILGTVAGVVGDMPNPVTVEGHTDTRPYSALRGGYSNWELSADRANSARRVLEASGLRPRQVTRVIGFADNDLLLRDRPLDAQNRRVSIVVARRPVAGETDAAPAADAPSGSDAPAPATGPAPAPAAAGPPARSLAKAPPPRLAGIARP